MTRQVKRSGLETVGLGIVAGAVAAVVLVAYSAATGGSIWLPFEMIASLVLGRDAMAGEGALSTILVGALLNIACSGGFGFLFGALSGLFPEAHLRLGRQVGLGMLFGGALCAVDFQLLGRLLWPWFLELPQVLLLFMHVLVFGPFVAVMYRAAARREQAHPTLVAT